MYDAARIGDLAVRSTLCPKISGFCLVLVSLAALTLAGCGRRGPLDLPPTAASASSANAAPAAPADPEAAAASRPSVFNPSYGADAAPAAPKGGKKAFILDPLLGN